MQQKIEPILLKMILIGESKGGKSTLLQKYTEKTYTDDYVPTLGVEQSGKSIEKGQHPVKLRISDATGIPSLRHLTHYYMKEAHGALICIDLSQPHFFEQISFYVDLFRQYNPTAPIILVGCKSDIATEQTPNYQRNLEKACAKGLIYIETSAKKDSNVSLPFEHLSNKILLTQELNKINNGLTKCFSAYLEANPSNQLFFKLSAEELLIKDEYQTLLHSFTTLSTEQEFKSFFLCTAKLALRAEKLHKKENPLLSIAVTSNLYTVLRNSLTILCGMPAYIADFSSLKEELQKKTSALSL